MACLVVSDTVLRAQLLAGLLSQCCPVTIAAACESVAAIALIERNRPDLVILDRDGETDDCERIARHLIGTCASARLILLSSDPRLDPLRRDLAPVIESIGSWEALLRVVRTSDPTFTRQAGGRQTGLVDPLPDGSRFERLSPRERSVLELIGAGLASRDMATSLGVSLQTVETYRKNVSAKLGVSGARLVRIAVLYSCVHVGRLLCQPPAFAGCGHGLSAHLSEHPQACHRREADPALLSDA